MAKSLLLAFTTPTSADDEAEFNNWYDKTHIPQVKQAIPSMTEVNRYRVVDFAAPDAPVRYITVYEIDSEDIGAAAQQLGAAGAAGQLDQTATMDVTSNPPVLTWAVGV